MVHTVFAIPIEWAVERVACAALLGWPPLSEDSSARVTECVARDTRCLVAESVDKARCSQWGYDGDIGMCVQHMRQCGLLR